MGTVRYAINVTLDGCCHHEEGLPPDPESMAFWTEEVRRADALVYGRVTYLMMQEAWRRPESGIWPEWMSPDEQEFAEVIDAAPKHVVSQTLESVDWNASLIPADPVGAVRAVKEAAAGTVLVGGVDLPRVLADAGLIDEYVFVVHPVIAARGPRLLDGLAHSITLREVDRHPFASGACAVRYRAQ